MIVKEMPLPFTEHTDVNGSIRRYTHLVGALPQC